MLSAPPGYMRGKAKTQKAIDGFSHTGRSTAPKFEATREPYQGLLGWWHGDLQKKSGLGTSTGVAWLSSCLVS